MTLGDTSEVELLTPNRQQQLHQQGEYDSPGVRRVWDAVVPTDLRQLKAQVEAVLPAKGHHRRCRSCGDDASQRQQLSLRNIFSGAVKIIENQGRDLLNSVAIGQTLLAKLSERPVNDSSSENDCLSPARDPLTSLRTQSALLCAQKSARSWKSEHFLLRTHVDELQAKLHSQHDVLELRQARVCDLSEKLQACRKEVDELSSQLQGVRQENEALRFQIHHLAKQQPRDSNAELLEDDDEAFLETQNVATARQIQTDLHDVKRTFASFKLETSGILSEMKSWLQHSCENIDECFRGLQVKCASLDEKVRDAEGSKLAVAPLAEEAYHMSVATAVEEEAVRRLCRAMSALRGAQQHIEGLTAQLRRCRRSALAAVERVQLRVAEFVDGVVGSFVVESVLYQRKQDLFEEFVRRLEVNESRVNET